MNVDIVNDGDTNQSEDLQQLKSDSIITQVLSYQELLVREQCELIKDKWLLLQEDMEFI